MVVASAAKNGVWKELFGPILEKVPNGYLFAGWCVLLLAWVLKSSVPPAVKAWRQDRENRRKHELQLKKFEAEIEAKRKG